MISRRSIGSMFPLLAALAAATLGGAEATAPATTAITQAIAKHSPIIGRDFCGEKEARQIFESGTYVECRHEDIEYNGERKHVSEHYCEVGVFTAGDENLSCEEFCNNAGTQCAAAWPLTTMTQTCYSAKTAAAQANPLLARGDMAASAYEYVEFATSLTNNTCSAAIHTTLGDAKRACDHNLACNYLLEEGSAGGAHWRECTQVRANGTRVDEGDTATAFEKQRWAPPTERARKSLTAAAPQRERRNTEKIVDQGSCKDGVQNGDETGVDCGGRCGICDPNGCLDTNHDMQICRCERTPPTTSTLTTTTTATTTTTITQTTITHVGKWLGTYAQAGQSACMTRTDQTNCCAMADQGTFESWNFHGCAGHCNANGHTSLLLKANTDWQMNGFRYNDVDWVSHERVTKFRIEYSNDLTTWTSVFETDSPDTYKVGRNVEATWAPKTARYWRWNMLAQNCATVASFEWSGVAV